MKSFALLAVAALLALPARACLNDRDSDSLATQAAQLPETLRVIIGRFERNPPLYYQMRIERERAALAATPKQFGLYDDIGVALDKLGRSDEALETMKSKRAVLPAFNPKDSANKEAWYRTFANEGTFRAHRYLKSGAPIEDLSEMKTARDQIKRAIEIKPDAHFGRERYQLMAMDWIIARKSGKTQKTLGEWIAGRDGWKWVDDEQTLQSSGRERAVEGLSGLIVLGGAWESPDVFQALGAALQTKESVTLNYLAFLRVEELLDEGKTSFWKRGADSKYLASNDSVLGDYGIGVNWDNEKPMRDLFKEQRANAKEWNTTRKNWMLARLEHGEHPDTNPKFWDGYSESAPPLMKMDWSNPQTRKAERQRIERISKLITNGFILTFICGCIFFGVRHLRRTIKTT